LLSTDPHEIDEPPEVWRHPVSALYNFNQETLSIPALGVKLGVDAPTGIDSRASPSTSRES